MITTCTDCQARYQLDATKVPHRVIKVRCPSCTGVFELDGTRAEAPAAPAAAVETPAVQPPVAETPVVADPFAGPAPSAPVVDTPSLETEAVPAGKTGVAVLEETAPVGGRRRRPKEEMLARALVSDILVYNKDLRDEALANGTLLEALGGEIKKSWELYKEKVTPDVANSTNYFREALNDILAEGDKIF